MAMPVYTLAPNPHWVIIDNFSKLPNGAAIYTYRSLAPSQFKPAFEDAAGMIPYGQPITGFGNGTMPPIFWEFDPNNPNETYYIRVYDSANPTTQNFLWDFDGLSGASGSGGGVIVTNNDIENLVVNGAFYRNIGTQATLSSMLTLAPSNNAGYVSNPANGNGPTGPDIVFAKSNTTATDTITFPLFSPVGIQSLVPDVTPVNYFHYECTGAGTGETYKYVQFPICQNIQNLSGATVSVKIWARCNSGNTNLGLTFRQFFGDGGSPSPDNTLIVSGAPLPLTNNWQLFTFNAITLPSATIGGTLGKCGNDALFLQVTLPLSALTNIDFVKPSVYLGPVVPTIDFHSYDQIDALINTPRTGDIRTTINSFLPGWVQMNDGTIGNKDGGGDSNATARDNNDTFPLFNLIWSIFNSSPTLQALAPMFTSAGSPTTYGASAIADFTVYNQLSLTRNLGRVMAGALPVSVSQSFTSAANVLTVSSTASFITGAPVIVTGGSLPAGLAAGTTYYAIVLTLTTMSLATTPANAIAGSPVITFGAGSGTVTIPAHGLGSFLGEELHQLIQNELPSPITANINTQSGIQAGAGGPINPIGAGASSSVTLTLSGTPNQGHNTMQPTVFMNVFIKL